jgi:hypothetical protein
VPAPGIELREVRKPPAPEPESPRDFVERRMRELEGKDIREPDSER